MSRTRALLATLRIANAPSVVSNVWLGYLTGWLTLASSFDFDTTDWTSLLILCLAGLLLYFAGNLANDWFDQKWDEMKRPERALPSGAFRPTTYLSAAVMSGGAGIVLGFTRGLPTGFCAIAIAALIVVYTRFHKQTPWAVIPMGLCRAALYFLGFLAYWSYPKHLEFDVAAMFVDEGRHIITLAIGLFSYITGLSISARYESMENPPQGPRAISKALLILPLAAMSCWFMPGYPLFGIVGMIPFALWLTLCFTRFRRPIPRYVSALLAGIPLVDFIAAAPLALLANPGWSLIELVEHPHLMALLAVPLATFVLGRLLQKVAPAT